MNTGNSVGNFNFNSNSNTSNTSNNLNLGNIQNTSTLSTGVSYNYTPTTEVETMDLSSAVSTVDNNSKSILSSVGEWFSDTAKSVFATGAVVTRAVRNGVANIGEGLVDGITWCGGKVVEGASFLGGKIAGWFSDDAEESVMEWRQQAKLDVKEFISTDLVGEANEKFYQETAVGQWINENSYLKYDSKLAQGITNVTELGGKIALATAATILSGGTAAPALAPLLLGFTYGVGEKSEKKYQENINTTGAQELGIFVSGLGEAANWYALGKMGQGGLGLINTISQNGLKQTGAGMLYNAKSLLKNIYKNGFINTAKGVLKNSNWASLKATDNLADSAGIIGDNVSGWLIGDEELNLGNVVKAGKELIAAWGLNMIFDGTAEYILKNSDMWWIRSTDEYKKIEELAKQQGMTLEQLGSQKGTSAAISPETQEAGDLLAKQVRQAAERAEPKITADLKGLESDTRHLTGLDFRLKSEESLSRKIITDASVPNMTLKKAADSIGDSVRYTMICGETTMKTDVTECIDELIQKGYTVNKFKNSFGNDTYKGINVQLSAPDGTVMELQFHTEQSFHTKDALTHQFYEIERNQFTTKEQKQLAHDLQQKITAKVFVPEGMETFKISEALKDKYPTLAEHMPEVYVKELPLSEELTRLAKEKGMTLSELGGQKPPDTSDSLTKETSELLAKQVRMNAEQVEPRITADLESLQTDQRKLTGLDFKLKGEDSLARKIRTDADVDGITLQEAANKIGDSVRYTMLCGESTMPTDITECIDGLIQKGYKVNKFKNTFDNEIYKGINVQLSSPDGTVMELQFHTNQTYITKERMNHTYYEIYRNQFTTEQEKQLAYDIMKDTTSQIRIPDGMETFKITDALASKYDNIEEIMPAVYAKEHN